MSVYETVETWLGQLPAGLLGSPECPLALELARRIDDSGNSATSVSMCAGQLRDTLAALRVMAESAKGAERDGLDDLKARRDQRRARAAGAKS